MEVIRGTVSQWLPERQTYWKALKGADIGLGGVQRLCINVQRQAVGAAQEGSPNAQHALHTLAGHHCCGSAELLC